MGLNHVSITVADRARSAAFYREHFGLEEEVFATEKGLVLGAADGATLAFEEGDVPPELPRGNHFGFQLESPDAVRAARERLRAAGVTETEFADKGDFARVQVLDPDGYRVELIGRAGTSVAGPPPGFPRVVAHLIYDDVDAAIAWLTAAFGFRERAGVRHTEADGSASRAQIEIADSLITIGRPSVHGDSPRHGVSSMLYIYVDDVDAHRRRAIAHGARLVTDLLTHAGDRRYQVADPEGHQWTFAQRTG